MEFLLGSLTTILPYFFSSSTMTRNPRTSRWKTIGKQERLRGNKGSLRKTSEHFQLLFIVLMTQSWAFNFHRLRDTTLTFTIH